MANLVVSKCLNPIKESHILFLMASKTLYLLVKKIRDKILYSEKNNFN